MSDVLSSAHLDPSPSTKRGTPLSVVRRHPRRQPRGQPDASFWLVYVHPPPTSPARTLLFLPALNALLNGLSAVALVVGSVHPQPNIAAHRASMFTAFIFSTLFLVSYITNHALHGDMHFPWRRRGASVLLHAADFAHRLSMIALPLILVTFFLSLTAASRSTKRVARWTFPILALRVGHGRDRLRPCSLQFH